MLPDFVGLYGREDFDRFARRAEVLHAHLARPNLPSASSSASTCAARCGSWRSGRATTNEHVRRLASEGSRPRLPWSFKLRELIADPSPVAPILENLRADPSLYVRKSVANHLNDITKDHPAWVLERIGGWDLENKHTAWIAKRALRTLIKKGDRNALAVIGAGARAEIAVRARSPSRRDALHSATSWRLSASVDLHRADSRNGSSSTTRSIT